MMNSDTSLKHLYRAIPANTLIPLQRLQSLAFGFGTFAFAKDRAPSPHDGLLKDSPVQMFILMENLKSIKGEP